MAGDPGEWWKHGVPGTKIDLPHVRVREDLRGSGQALVFVLSRDHDLNVMLGSNRTVLSLGWPDPPAVGPSNVLRDRLVDVLHGIGVDAGGGGASRCRMVIYASKDTPWMAVEHLLDVAADKQIAIARIEFCVVAETAKKETDDLKTANIVTSVAFALPWEVLTGKKPAEPRGQSVPRASVRLEATVSPGGSKARQAMASCGLDRYRVPQDLSGLVAAVKIALQKVPPHRSGGAAGTVEVASDAYDASLTYEAVLQTYVALLEVAPSGTYFTRLAPWEAAPSGEGIEVPEDR